VKFFSVSSILGRRTISLPPDEDNPELGLSDQSGSRLGKGSIVVGKVSFQGPARIDGQVDGDITSTGTLILGETAVITTPRMRVASVIIAGKVSGDIMASEQIVIARSARVLGKLYSPAVAIEDGAWFDGHCKVMRADSHTRHRLAPTG
jgi:cytoskeletal protein CcmA (bactofilin family)